MLLTLVPTLLMGGLQVLQAYIRQRMQTSLQHETMVTIHLPAADIVWYEEGREIMVNGRMFDIKNCEIKDGFFTATGIYDDDETELVNLLRGLWSERDQQLFVIQLLVLSHCLIPIFFLQYTFCVTTFVKKLRTLFSPRYTAPLLAIPVPPPRLVLFSFL